MQDVPDQSLRVDAGTGLLRGVRQVLSPHFDARPASNTPDLIVIHGISLPPSEYGQLHVEAFFCGNLRAEGHPYFAQICGQRVSAHVWVRRNGELVQFVPFGQRAWHAGVSAFGERVACNDFSIGIELEGDDEQAYEFAQYEAAAALVRALLAAYSTLSADRVVGHSDIAPGRKTDPGAAFDWPRFKQMVKA